MKLEADSLQIAEEAESNLKSLRVVLDQTEKALAEKSIAQESLKWKLNEYSNQVIDLKQKLDTVSQKFSEQKVFAQTKSLEEAIYEKTRLLEDLKVARKKLEAYMTVEGGAPKNLLEELSIYKVQFSYMNICIYQCFRN